MCSIYVCDVWVVSVWCVYVYGVYVSSLCVCGVCDVCMCMCSLYMCAVMSVLCCGFLILYDVCVHMQQQCQSCVPGSTEKNSLFLAFTAGT